MDFNKRGKNFDTHINEEHNQWKYIYFLYYLNQKGEDHLNGTEQLCWNDYRKYKTDWLPIGKTSYLTRDYDETNLIKKTQERLTDVEKNVSENYTQVMKEIIYIKNSLGIGEKGAADLKQEFYKLSPSLREERKLNLDKL